VLIAVVDGQPVRTRVNLTSGFANGRRVARALTVTDAAPF